MLFRKKPSFNDNDVQSIITACISENAEAQKALINMFLSFAKNICLPFVSNKQEAEEIVNDGFLKVFKNLEKYDDSRSFKTWIKSIFINTAIDHYRKNLKHLNHVNIDYLDLENDDVDIVSKISAEEIVMLIQKLPPTYKMVFNLYVIEGYNHREIAEMLNIQEGTSKSNLRDARKKLKHLIQQHYPQLYMIYALKTTKINEN